MHIPCLEAHPTATEQFPHTLEHLKDELKWLQASLPLSQLIQLKASSALPVQAVVTFPF